MSLESIRKKKGFWDGGRGGYGTSRESGGRPSGFPGHGSKKNKQGLQIDLDEIPRRKDEESNEE